MPSFLPLNKINTIWYVICYSIIKKNHFLFREVNSSVGVAMHSILPTGDPAKMVPRPVLGPDPRFDAAGWMKIVFVLRFYFLLKKTTTCIYSSQSEINEIFRHVLLL